MNKIFFYDFNNFRSYYWTRESMKWRKHPAYLLPQGCVSNFLFPQVQWIATPSAHSAPPCRPPPPSPSTLSPSTPPWYSTAGRTLSFPFPGFVCGQQCLTTAEEVWLVQVKPLLLLWQAVQAWINWSHKQNYLNQSWFYGHIYRRCCRKNGRIWQLTEKTYFNSRDNEKYDLVRKHLNSFKNSNLAKFP